MESSTPTVETGTATTGPASFSDTSLTWTEDSSASTPSSETTPAASASADATVPPAADTPPDGSTPAAGEPPKERWADILTNARTKAAEEALAPLAWAQGINPQEFSQIQTLARQLYGGGNPVEGLQTLIAELRKDPQVEAQIRSFAAKTLAQRSQPAEPQEPQPDLPIQLEDGRVVHLYSAEQQAKREAFLQRQWLASVQQELQPLKQAHEQTQQQAAAVARQQQVDTFVSTTFADVQTWPGMQDKAALAAVAKELSNARIDESDPREVSLALNAAYRKVVLPTLSQRTEASLLDSLQRKAAASTGVNPGSAAATTSKPIRSFSDLGPEAWR